MLFLIGAIFRRIWGGFHTPPHMVKVLLAYPLAFLSAYIQTGNLYASLTFGLIIGTSFNNWFHAWGQGMGMDHPGKSTLACLAVMGGSYGAFTTATAISLVYFTGVLWYALYALAGPFIAIAYLLSWKYYPRGYILWGGFMDGTPTALAECVLGAVLLGI